MMTYFLDANGTDGTDLSLMDAVWEDGTRIPADDQAAIDAKEANLVTKEQAQTAAATIPGWASWTEAQALDWHDTNVAAALPVANLTEANAVLEDLATENRALIRMVLALRNAQWPDLEGS